MTKVSVFIATSMDGFIAREDGDIEWLHGNNNSNSDEDYGYNKFIKSVDALVMGRNSYEKVLSFGGAWPYGKTPVFVLTNRGIDIPDNISETVSQMSGSPGEIIRQLGEKGHDHLYLDGGLTIQGFLEEGLVDQLIITRIPILIGSGIPLFGPLSHDIKLKHVETRSYDDGLVQSRYEVI